MKRLIFLSTFDYPSRYAHAIHGEYMARAFHEKFGENFLFFINTAKQGALEGVPYRLLFGRFGRRIKLLHIRSLLLPFSLARFFYINSLWQGRETLVFVNDPMLIKMAVWLKRRFGVQFIFESHGSLSSEQECLLADHALRVISLTSFLEKDTLLHRPQLKGRTLVIPNAVDIEAFKRVTDDRMALRRELSLPEGFLVGYVGRFEPLGSDKGLRLMIESLRDLPSDVRLLLVGGSKDEIARYTEIAATAGMEERVTFVPHVASELVPKYERACDVLAYVPANNSVFYAKETSPMKLFEYMASKRPSIVSDMPTIREVVPNAAAFFVVPGSKEAFQKAVAEIRSQPIVALERAERALRIVEANTWERRVGRILENLI